jgi:hypothetical protein
MSVRKSAANASFADRKPLVAGDRVWPAGMTTIIGLAFLSAIRLSRMKPARPTELHEWSLSPAPCSR